jgi:hypothetical protein
VKYVKLFENWTGTIDPSIEKAVDIIAYFILRSFDIDGGNNYARENWEDRGFEKQGPDIYVNMKLTDCANEIELVNRAIKDDPRVEKFLIERMKEYELEIEEPGLDPEETVATLYLNGCGQAAAHGMEKMGVIDRDNRLRPGTTMKKIIEFYDTVDDKIEALETKYQKRLRAKSSGLI